MNHFVWTIKFNIFCPKTIKNDDPFLAHLPLQTGSGGKPSTWLPPGGLVEHQYNSKHIQNSLKASVESQKLDFASF